MSDVSIRKGGRTRGRLLSRRLGKLARFLVSIAVTFFGLLFVTFMIGRILPIDPVLAVVGDRAPAEVYEKARIAMGLDLPLYEQFFIYVGNVLQGNFGESVLTARPVLEDIKRVFPATIELATVATIIGFCWVFRLALRRRCIKAAGPITLYGLLVWSVIPFRSSGWG